MLKKIPRKEIQPRGVLFEEMRCVVRFLRKCVCVHMLGQGEAEDPIELYDYTLHTDLM